MIKAHIITWSEDTAKIVKKKKTLCWIAINERIPTIEVALPDLKNGLHQAVYIDLKEIIADLKRLGEI